MGNPTLRQRCQEVTLEDIRTEKVQDFVNDLIDTMRDKNGAGIAASQVGQLQRIFIMEGFTFTNIKTHLLFLYT